MANKPRVLLASAFDIDSGYGGAPMRGRALRAALATFADVSCMRLKCRHDAPCGHNRSSSMDPFGSYFCELSLKMVMREVSQEGFHVLVVTELPVHRYSKELARHSGVPVVFDMHNVEYPLHCAIGREAPAGSRSASYYTPEHCAAVYEVEHETLRTVHQVWACSQADKDISLAYYPDIPQDRIRVVPNAVAVQSPKNVPRGSSRSLFTGRLDYYPNIDAVRTLSREISPRLRRSCRELPMTIAGGWVTEEVRSLIRGSAIELIERPDDTSELIRQGIMTVPLRIGSGSRFKILEALSLGSPVVSSSKGAEGLDLTPGEHFIVADSAEEMADALTAVFRDENIQKRLRVAGLDLIRRNYSIDSIAEAVESAIMELIE